MRIAFFHGNELNSDKADNRVDPERQEIREAVQKALQLLEPYFRAVVVLRLARGQEKLKDILTKWKIV